MIEIPQNSSHSKLAPGLQVAWDSTSLGALKLCPRLYQYSILQGFEPRETNVHLTFGLAFHAALETYDKAKARGTEHSEAMRSAVRRALKDTWNEKLRRPWLSDDKNKNRGTLLRTVVWYLDHFESDPLETLVLASGQPAVELSFRIPTGIAASTGEELVLCGHLDKIARMGERNYILDRKTTKWSLGDRYFQQFSPHNQFTLYTLAGGVAYQIPLDGLICDAAQVGVTFSRFERKMIPRTPEQLDEWLVDFEHWTKVAEGYAKEGYWPMNDKSCDHFGGCAFREICSKTPAVRDKWLAGQFGKRVWDPLVVRGDV